MKYCKRCLQPDTRPNIYFDDEGVCGACLYESEKNSKIDWNVRRNELMQIVENAKWKGKSKPYDCVVGVSGGKDSHFQAIYAKEKLGLRVLLVNGVCDEITDIGRHNLDNLCNQGFDLISLRPNPLIAKKLAKKSFVERGNIVGPSEYALWASAYIIADKFDIPLVIQGENAALTLGVSIGNDKGGDSLSVLNLSTISGCRSKDLLFDSLELYELYMYDFPIGSISRKGIKGIWLQYYVKEWSQVGNGDFAVARGLIGRGDELHNIGRYRRLTALDSNLAIVNQMIKYYKFGFGFATDEACYDIREGRISRDDAKWLINEYDGKCGEKYVDEACNYLQISKNEFWSVVDKFVNKTLFTKTDGKWVPKFRVGVNYDI